MAKNLIVTSTDTARDPKDTPTLLARCRKFLARFLFFAAALVLFVFVASRLVTDRYLFSQFAFWIPSWVYVLFTVMVLALERLLSARPVARWKSPSWWMLLFLAGCTCFMAYGAIPRLAHTLPEQTSLRIVHWNMSSPDLLTFQGTLADFPACKAADIILLGVNVPEAQLEHMVAGLGEAWTVNRIGVFAVASRFKIHSAKLFSLGLHTTGRRSGSSVFQDFYNEQVADRLGVSRREFNLPDPGYVMETVIQAPEGAIVVRLIDLPSNPFRSRMQIATQAAAKIAELEKSKLLVPNPHVLLGDCNIPGGSASLKHLSMNMVAAETISQSGDSWPTWPRALPLLRIDHAWVSPGIPVLSYHTFDGGISDHRGQSLQIGIAADVATPMR